MTKVGLIINDIRSAHNVGSLLRTADCLGVEHVWITGYSPYPEMSDDSRLPHEIQRAMKQLHKTALGAESNTNITYERDISELLAGLKKRGYKIVALEQSSDSQNLAAYRPPDKAVLLIGREVEGIEQGLLDAADDIVEIPMSGRKESLNVVQAAAIALYKLLN